MNVGVLIVLLTCCILLGFAVGWMAHNPQRVTVETTHCTLLQQHDGFC